MPKKEAFYNAEELYQMIERRYRPPEWAVLPGVANATGGGMRRRCDALAMNLWPSRGLEIHGFEIKISRADFIRELKDPEKAEKIAKFCDRWWMVVSEADIVQDGELPPTWGLLVARGTSLRLTKEAEKLSPEPISRGFFASVLRTAISSSANARFVDEVKREAQEEGYKAGERGGEQHRQHLEAELHGAEKKLEKLAKALGVIQMDLGWHPDERLAQAFRFAFRFAMRNVEEFGRIRGTAEKIIAACDEAKILVDGSLEPDAERTDA